ncbi:VOC family protein [Paenibacillus ihumii]|uniref:VOC family protein n=1 Tax=Paenibacillus ihumii TaxID=687436 RepID=UPI0006D85E82|nr:VOC family protein [Paenibacillus ihumii]
MSQGFACCLQIFPTPDIHRTARFYEGLGFRSVYYLESQEPHVCLYRDAIEIVLTQSNCMDFLPNRAVHGYGYDAYFITTSQEEIQRELQDLGVNIVRPLSTTDYSNKEFVFEDVDGRWIAVGNKVN